MTTDQKIIKNRLGLLELATYPQRPANSRLRKLSVPTSPAGGALNERLQDELHRLKIESIQDEH